MALLVGALLVLEARSAFFAPADTGESRGTPLYLTMHHMRTGLQTITVTLPHQPARAGIDPRHLLIDVEPDDNVIDVSDTSPSPA